MNFGEAVQAAKEGSRIARSGWDGKGAFVFLKKGSVDFGNDERQSYIDGIRSSLFESGAEGTATRLPCLCMKTASGSTLEGWLASQTDILACDWDIVVDQ